MIGCGLVVDWRGFVLTSATLTPDIESLYVIDHEDKKYEADVITADTYVVECKGSNIAMDEEIVSNICVWREPDHLQSHSK